MVSQLGGVLEGGGGRGERSLQNFSPALAPKSRALPGTAATPQREATLGR